jgi:hypothetical protein
MTQCPHFKIICRGSKSHKNLCQQQQQQRRQYDTTSRDVLGQEQRQQQDVLSAAVAVISCRSHLRPGVNVPAQPAVLQGHQQFDACVIA